jgi:hypothetical protein
VAAGGYGFGERVAALVGPDASAETIALIQHVLRATNPAGSLQAAHTRLRGTPGYAHPADPGRGRSSNPA